VIEGEGLEANVKSRLFSYDKMLSYCRETVLQGALQFSPKVQHWNWETIFYAHCRSIFKCLTLTLSLRGSPANIAINDISLKSTFFGLYISAAESIRVSSTTFTQSAQIATEFGEINQPLGLVRRSRSPILVQIKSSYATSYW